MLSAHWPTPRAQVFTRMLHTVPFTVVESRKEADDIKELLAICKHYHIALRCELKRKVRRASCLEGEHSCPVGALTPCKHTPCMHCRSALRCEL